VQQTICVIVAEDNDDLRAVMPPLIDDNPDMQCVGVTAYIDEVAPLIEQHQAHVAVLKRGARVRLIGSRTRSRERPAA